MAATSIRQRVQAIEQSGGEGTTPRRIHVSSGQVVGGSSTPSRRKPGSVLCVSAETLEKQAGGNQDDGRQCRFDRHQPATHRAARRLCRARSQHGCADRPAPSAAPERRRRSPRTRCQARREREASEVDARLKPDRELRREQRHGAQRVAAPHRNDRRRARQRAPPSTRFSTSSRRATRHRPAPIARRTPISRWRVLARASTRLAVLPQTASSSSSMTACSSAAPEQEPLRPARGAPELLHVGAHA